MEQKLDAAGTGRLVVAVFMVVFVIITLIMWIIIALQMRQARHRHLADIESGIIDSNHPWRGLHNSSRDAKSRRRQTSNDAIFAAASTSSPSVQQSVKAQSSKSDIPHDSQWYAEERPLRYWIFRISQKLGSVFKKK
ncbi:hypothetical protein F5Y19DRAFT_488174 [Xylariaceae sp. FL1651]|nr:hypothetical protein F5Y19DRAFT_488174 [Xylariaceae sp. FL1651]